MTNIITKTTNGNYRLDVTQIEFPTYSEQMAGGRDNSDVKTAIKAVIEKEGPGGNHKWEIKIPPLPARNLLGGDVYVPEWQVIEGLSILQAVYYDYAKENEENDESAPLQLTDNEYDDFSYLDTRRWERIDDQTMAFDFKVSDENLDSYSPDDQYMDYQISHYEGMFEKYHPWFICLLFRAALRDQINPAIGAVLMDNYGWDEWPPEILTDDDKTLLADHPEWLEWIKGTSYEEYFEGVA